jgi:hypothetical protein
MYGSTVIERNLDLDFDLAKVKESIERAAKHGGYALNNKNDILNTYRITKMTGFEVVNMNITLKKIDEGRCSIRIETTERLRNSGHKIQIDQILDAFLERMSKALTGASDEELKTVSASNKGCLGLVAILILATGAVVSLLG